MAVSCKLVAWPCHMHYAPQVYCVSVGWLGVASANVFGVQDAQWW